MRWLVLIGDLVASRGLADRQAIQEHLHAALDAANADPAGITSPYTLTLGDEFQAVLTGGQRVFRDAVAIQAAVHPVLVRFSLAIGELSTDVNRERAIGMDGPAFHRARAGIEALRGSDTLLRLDGLAAPLGDIVTPSFNLVSQAFAKWQTRRFEILARLQRDAAVADIARALDVSEQAVYKNLSDGRLRDIAALFGAVGRAVDTALAGA